MPIGRGRGTLEGDVPTEAMIVSCTTAFVFGRVTGI
jgi:hypothetical protein